MTSHEVLTSLFWLVLVGYLVFLGWFTWSALRPRVREVADRALVRRRPRGSDVEDRSARTRRPAA